MGSVSIVYVSVAIGRLSVFLITGHLNVHELYTVAMGLYVRYMMSVFIKSIYISSWLALKFGVMIAEWLPRGWNVVVDGFRLWIGTVLLSLSR